MANPEHLAILQKGVEAWNQWRTEHRLTRPDLGGADLAGSNLERVNLSEASLISANLSDTKLVGSNLNRTTLTDGDLSGANLTSANLSDASLSGTSFNFANLSTANLTEAHLGYANLSSALLDGADLSGAQMRFTSINNVNLSNVRGLDTVKHYGPSSISIDTLYKSGGRIPDKFLRDAGVPEEIIDIARSIRTGPAIQWYSCFISYSTKDEGFARRLHARMRQAGLRVWFAPENLKGGDILHEQLFRAIELYERLLLVLSEHSVQSEWVMTEIRKAREVEKEENRRKLFPIRLVDFDTLRGWTCFDADTGKDLAVEVREYFIPDFSNWEDHDDFEAAFAKLLKDLEAEESKPKTSRARREDEML